MKDITGVTLVGSREIPAELKSQLGSDIVTITRWLAERDIEGFSGGAPGMDKAWAKGYRMAGKADLFYQILPWNGFEDFYTDEHNLILDDWMGKFSEQILLDLGVVWLYKTTRGVRAMYKRNVFQVLKPDYSKVELCIYFAPTTRKGTPKGGTAIAVRVAEALNVPCYNLGLPEERKALYRLLELPIEESPCP